MDPAQTMKIRWRSANSLAQFKRGEITWVEGEDTFANIMARLRRGDLSRSQDRVFSDGVFKPFDDAWEFAGELNGVLDGEKSSLSSEQVKTGLLVGTSGVLGVMAVAAIALLCLIGSAVGWLVDGLGDFLTRLWH